MKIIPTKYLICLLAFLLFNCGPKEQNENDNSESEVTIDLPDTVKAEQDLYDQIMLVHDEMMPKMEDLMNLKRNLIELADSLKESGNVDKAQHYNNTAHLIENADEAMMNWMRNFEPINDGQKHDEIMTYYTLQKSKMDSVKIIMQDALTEGEKTLNDLYLTKE